MKEYDRTREIINQLSAKSRVSASAHISEGKQILVIFTGSSSDYEEKLRGLIRGRVQGIRYDLMFSEAAEEILPIDNICLKLKPRRVIKADASLKEFHTLQGIDGIIVPFLTQNTAFKLSLGLQDQPVPSFLWQGLWIGKPVWMDLEGLNKYMGKETSSEALRKMIKDSIQGLKAMGVKELDKEDFMKRIFEELSQQDNASVDSTQETPKGHSTKGEDPKKSIITEADILKLPYEIKEIKLGSNSIITPLAYDTAKRRGIKIIRA